MVLTGKQADTGWATDTLLVTNRPGNMIKVQTGNSVGRLTSTLCSLINDTFQQQTYFLNIQFLRVFITRSTKKEVSTVSIFNVNVFKQAGQAEQHLKKLILRFYFNLPIPCLKCPTCLKNTAASTTLLASSHHTKACLRL